MASSGKVSSNGYEGRYITFSWSLTTQSIAANTSTIAWRLEGDGQAETSRYKAGNFKVVIDGVTVYSTSQDDRIWLYDGTLVASGNYTFNHNNQGEKSFSVQIQAGIYYYAVNCTGSGSFALPTINRISDITAVGGSNTSDELSVTYTEYVAAYTNNLIIKLGSTTLQTINDYQSGASFTLIDSALNTIYSTVTTAKTVTLSFSLQTYSGSLFIGTSDAVSKTLTINDSNPTIGGITYKDSNNTTAAITTDNQYIIRNYSTLQVTVSNLKALNSATLSSITVAGGGVSQTRSLSGSTDASEVFNLGTINQSSNFTLTVTLTDSRGFTATKSINILVYDYNLPTATISALRVDNYYTTTNVTVNANYASIGGHNTLSITAQYKKTSESSYGAAVTLSDGVTSTLSLDNNYEWNLKVIVADSLGSTTYNLIIGRGLPIWFVDRLLSSVGINCFPLENDSLEVNGLRLDDKIYIGSQSIYDYYETSAQGETVVATAYDYRLIEGVFSGINIPSNYEKAYKITFQYTTANSNGVKVKLNNILSNNCNTWSQDKFRSLGGTRLFKQSELTLEQCSGYSRNGLNLYISNSEAYTAKLWNITLHGYLVNKDTNLSISSYNLPDDDFEHA
ncbi:MAG: hypothetical protein J6M62_07260 [Selenomonadaceae bacterium]|nr:hypothetical protein [Selenomonadaceae bacterium]